MQENQPSIGKKRYLFLLVGVVVLAVVIYWAKPEHILDELKKADLRLILVAILLNLTTTILMLTRWFILYKSEAQGMPARDSSKIYLVGQATNQIAPMGTGEIARAYIGSRYYDIHFSKTLVSSVIERMVDIMFFLIIAMVSFAIFIPGGTFDNTIIVFIQIAIFLVLSSLGLIFVLKPHWMDRLFIWLEKMFEKRGEFGIKISTKLLSSWETFKESMLAYHKRKLILLTTSAFTVSIWFLDAVTNFILFRAFGLHVPYFYVLGIISISFIVGALSFLPGGLGSRELSFTILSTFFLIGKDQGLSVALSYRIIVYTVIGIGALISILSLPKELSRKNNEPA